MTGPGLLTGTFVAEGATFNVKCPCVVAYDPFKKNVNGGVPTYDAKLLAQAVTDQTLFDKGGFPGTFSFGVETGLEQAVWRRLRSDQARL